jgi:CheY-like chemotaxis protein
MEDLKKYTVLVVDDDDDLREVMSSTFEGQGFTVLVANNGAMAYEMVQENQVDLVVSDMKMPGGDGMSLLQNLRARHQVVPAVIFVTGFTEVPISECLALGANQVFPKPFNQKELLLSVRRALNI